MSRPPLALLVCPHEWAARSLDTILGPQGFALLHAFTGDQALERVRESDPDVVIIHGDMPDMDTEQLCLRLTVDGGLSPAAPVIAFHSTPISREERLRLLAAGAWDVFAPLDAEELLLRIERSIQGKLEADRARENALLDADTSLYSWQGIVRRMRELGAAADRHGRPLACVVVTSGEPPTPVDSVEFARTLRHVTRSSDVVGRSGPGEFVIITPDTDASGARTLAERIRTATTATVSGAATYSIGTYGVRDLRAARLDPMELLVRATVRAHEPETNTS
ncbi:MAG TPA: response regulator [Longimicrobiales bacterium]|nr:response regulator [Longimicrobiales bacterium]